MRHSLKALQVWASVSVIMLLTGMIGPAAAEQKGSWHVERDSRDHPGLLYRQGDKQIFFIGVGRAIGLWIAYPGPPQPDGPATITIRTSSRTWKVKGELTNDHTFNSGGERATYFLQWDMGLSRPTPEFVDNLIPRYNKFMRSLLNSKKIVIVTKAGTITLPRIDAKGAREAMRI